MPDHPEILYALIPVYLKDDRFQAAAEAADRLAKNPQWRDRAQTCVATDPACPGRSGRGHRLTARACRHVSGRSLPTPPARCSLPRTWLASCLPRGGLPKRDTSCKQSWPKGPTPRLPGSRAARFFRKGRSAEALAALKEAGSYADDNPTLPDPAPFVGAASCAECHAEKFKAQQSSRHARTFLPVSQISGLALPRPSFPDPAEPKVTHTLRKIDGRLEQETRTSDRVFKAVVDYAFGSGDRGKTLVGHDDSGHMFELRLSVYHEGAQDSLGRHERA